MKAIMVKIPTVHYFIPHMFISFPELCGAVCDPDNAIVQLGKNATRYRRKVTCGNCKRTKVFRKVK